jgi:hypothetical protein
MTDQSAQYTLEFSEYLDGYEIVTKAKGYLTGIRVSTRPWHI